MDNKLNKYKLDTLQRFNKLNDNPNIFNVSETFPRDVFEYIPELTGIGKHNCTHDTAIRYLTPIEMLKMSSRIESDWICIYTDHYILSHIS